MADALKRDWDAATSGLCSAEVSEKWWGIVSVKYSAGDRLYHNVAYISDLFGLYHQHKEKLANTQAVALAIFFHKLEYSARAGDGEDKSVEQFKKFVEEAGEDAEQSAVSPACRCLLQWCCTNLTEAHTTEGGSGAEDHHYLLDMTMAGLGGDHYEDYTARIQAEYCHLTDDAYAQLNLKILQSLLLIPNVFATKDFQDLYEKQARKNIAGEIETLKKNAALK